MEERVLRNIVKFSKRIRRDSYAKVYAPLADSYRRIGLYEEAVQICQTGLKTFPRYLACHEVLGKVYLRQGHLTDARRELEKVADVVTDSLDLKKALAKVYTKIGDWKKVEPLLKEVIEKDPFDFEMRTFLTQRQRETELAAMREEAIARGEDPDELDIYDLANRQTAVVDIHHIIAGEENPSYDPEVVARATDDTLNNLEGLEQSIDTVADRLTEEAEQAKPAAKQSDLTDDEKRSLLRRQEMLAMGLEELNLAAIVAQIELEISLLDEALILCQRLQKDDPDDEELTLLDQKIDQYMQQKEVELEKLEKINLSQGA